MTAAVDGVTAARLAAYRVRAQRHRPAQRVSQPFEATWREWMATVFPQFDMFGPHHERFWDWLWDIERGVRPPPWISLWSRGGWKSGSAELGTVALGATGRRLYGLYVSGTQQQAEAHLDSIAALLSSPTVAQHYPLLANPAVNRFGSLRGWRRNRLVTEAGFTIDAVGLRTGTRGIKFEDQRPDFMVGDDIDELDDTPETTQKKIHTFTHTLLPAGSSDLATLAIQNLILTDGLFARLVPDAAEPATFLADRMVSGPVPAIRDLEYEERDGRAYIVGGTATWAGQPIETAQQQINDWGIDAFLAEAQHEPRARGEKIYSPAWWDGQARYRTDDTALLNRAVARFMSWDTAESTSPAAAWTACVVGDLVPFRNGYALLIRDVWRDRVEFTGLLDAIEARARLWGFAEDARLQQRHIYIEYASSGRQAVQALKSASATLRGQAPAWLSPFIQRFPPLGSKDDRSIQAATIARRGRVWLPERDCDDVTDKWLHMLEAELYSVPNAQYRDITDALAQLCLAARSWLREPAEQTDRTAA